MIGVIDYGMGNLGSVVNALDYLGLEAEVVDNPNRLVAHDHLILPGVGSFCMAMRSLDMSGWSAALRQKVIEGVPLLGICLGMQLFFEAGEEHGPTVGLGLIPGRVVPLNRGGCCRVPHVGWNGLTHARRHPVFRGVPQHVDFYFVHSYQCLPDLEGTVIARCDYGGEFVAAVAKDNVVGVQFHPERSQDMGLKLLKNFSEWDGSVC